VYLEPWTLPKADGHEILRDVTPPMGEISRLRLPGRASPFGCIMLYVQE
jgi:hypothetical protein